MEFSAILKLLRNNKMARIRRKSWKKDVHLALGIILVDGSKTKLMDTRSLEKLDAFHALDWEEYRSFFRYKSKLKRKKAALARIKKELRG